MRRVDTNIYEFRLHDGKPLPAYDPGAHIDLHLPKRTDPQNYSLIVAKPEAGRNHTSASSAIRRAEARLARHSR